MAAKSKKLTRKDVFWMSFCGFLAAHATLTTVGILLMVL